MLQNRSFTMCQIRNIVSAVLVLGLITLTSSAEFVQAQEKMSEGQRREVLQNLERGASALRVLGKNDEAERLIRIAQELSQSNGNWVRPEARERTGDRKAPERSANEAETNERAMTERQLAERQLDVFRMAHHAFREAEKGDAVEVMERIIHGRELQMAGRRDEEAQQAIRKIPGREDQIELLTRASGIWKEFGNVDKSQALASLADQMRQPENRTRNAERTETRDQPTPLREATNRDRQMEDIHQHMRRMSEQIEQIQKQLNELRDRR
jgi:hypothetical protein